MIEKNKRLKRHLSQRMIIYIISLFLFSGCIVIMNGIKQTTKSYYEVSIRSYEDSLWDTFYSNFKNAYEFGKFSLAENSEIIQSDIKETLDMNRLRNSLINNIYYYDFDLLLRGNLQDNVFTLRSYNMNRNRNSIIVLCNGKIIANYSHTLYGVPYKEDQKINGNDIKEIINAEFFNKELSLNAINKIESQSTDLIVWQETASTIKDAKTYTSIDWNTIKEIFQTQGIEGFAPYEILIPTYITDYGNIFGEYDNANGVGINNKIIIIQKLNIKDYFLSFMPDSDIVTFNKLNEMKIIYENILIITNIFEIILYLSIGAYVLFVVFNINKLIDEINDCTCTESIEKE